MKGPESVQCTADSILSNPYAGIQFAFDKRRRNLEKRKSRLLQYETDLKEGKKLSEQQIEARFCIGEVETQLEFLKDIGRTLASFQKEYLRGVKQRDEGMKKEYAESERMRLEDFICYQNVIKQFGKEEVREAFVSGTNNAVKITEEEYKLVENLSEAFGLNRSEAESFLECKEGSKEGSKLAYRILLGSKEKIVNNFSGAQIRELLEKIANCGYMQDGAKEEDQFVKSEGSAPEDEVEQPKKDPKVVFVHVSNGSAENYAEDELNEAGDTEFGFEGCVDPKVVVRDPPPPIPLPVTVVPEDPTNTINGANRDDVWHTANTETKPGASLKRRAEGLQNGVVVNGVEQVSGLGTRSGERRQIRGNRGGAQRNDYGSSGMRGNDFGKNIEGEQRVGGRSGGGGGIRRQERDGHDGPRNPRGASRSNGRSLGNPGSRGGAANFASRASGYRNGVANQMNGGFKSGRSGGNFNGYGYNGPPARRHLGFNFASDAF